MKMLLYSCKAKPYLIRFGNEYGYNQFDTSYCKEEHISPYEYGSEILNGKIVAECDFEVEEIKNKLTNNNSHLELFTDSLTEKELFEKSCLNRYEMFSYLKNDFTKKDEIKGYAIHIKNLHIFDKPKELNKCWANTNAWIFSNHRIEKAPQNMQYCGNWNLEKCILISINPQWLVRILNHEKTIEVRKKVLKEMLK